MEKQLWFNKTVIISQVRKNILLSKANVIVFYSTHDKGSEAFILGNIQNIYDFTFLTKTSLLFWHVLINMQNILKS